MGILIRSRLTDTPRWRFPRTFQPTSPSKIERLRALLGPEKALEVDGGIDVDTAGPCARAGATAFVAGTALFGAPDPAEAYRAIATAAEGG